MRAAIWPTRAVRPCTVCPLRPPAGRARRRQPVVVASGPTPRCNSCTQTSPLGGCGTCLEVTSACDNDAGAGAACATTPPLVAVLVVATSCSTCGANDLRYPWEACQTAPLRAPCAADVAPPPPFSHLPPPCFPRHPQPVARSLPAVGWNPGRGLAGSGLPCRGVRAPWQRKRFSARIPRQRGDAKKSGVLGLHKLEALGAGA